MSVNGRQRVLSKGRSQDSDPQASRGVPFVVQPVQGGIDGADVDVAPARRQPLLTQARVGIVPECLKTTPINDPSLSERS
jgi:hypothetical protein